LETRVTADANADTATVTPDAASFPQDAASVAAAREGMGVAERAVRLALLVALLYVFLIGVELLGSGIAGIGGGAADSLFRGVANPIAGLAIGVLATVLVQSSSVSSATIVALVGSGVVTVPDAVPMIMGANIGTTVTNTLASLGTIRRSNEFRRAFAGATVHDLFNLLAVAVLLPLELLTGMLSRTAIALSGVVGGTAGGEFNSPIKGAVGAGAGIFEAVAALFGEGTGAAVVLVILGLGLVFATLVAITRNMRMVIAGAAERSLNAVLERSGALGMLVGMAVTVAVQSSSITTSLLVPMMAAGVLTLRNAYPITLGANVGTTVTALIAALAVPLVAGLQIALVHLLFNLCGILLFYPVRALREVPIRGAEWLAEQAVHRRSAVLAYMVTVFLLVPGIGVMLLG
jgi:sodium-dependent phosphate cotransporter